MALIITLPLLTLIADALGIVGGWVVSTFLYGLPSQMFISSVRDGINTDDITGGIKDGGKLGDLGGAISAAIYLK